MIHSYFNINTSFFLNINKLNNLLIHFVYFLLIILFKQIDLFVITFIYLFKDLRNHYIFLNQCFGSKTYLFYIDSDTDTDKDLRIRIKNGGSGSNQL